MWELPNECKRDSEEKYITPTSPQRQHISVVLCCMRRGASLSALRVPHRTRRRGALGALCSPVCEPNCRRSSVSGSRLFEWASDKCTFTVVPVASWRIFACLRTNRKRSRMNPTAIYICCTSRVVRLQFHFVACVALVHDIAD